MPERGPWLPGFEWAVPAAFAAAVSACRFEQGDVLYAERSAYDDWSDGPPQPWIQVLDPPRSARARSADGDAGRFGSSWGAPVTLEIGQGADAEPRPHTTTQGRLFTCLWKADLDALEATEAPPPPLLLADLQRGLEHALPSVRAALLAEGAGAGSRRRGPAKGGAGGQALLFLSGVDLASDGSLAKAEAIWTALAAGHALRVHDASPAECGIPDGAAYHPSLVVRGIAIEATDGAPVGQEQVTEALKAALYNPNPSARGTSAATPAARESDAIGSEVTARADRFSLARHGWLGPLDAETGSKP